MARILVLSRADVEAALDPDALIEALAGGMRDLSSGAASVPPRVGALVNRVDGLLAAMPAFAPSADALASKLVTLFPHNVDRPTHQALIAVFDPDSGTPVAVMDGTSVTALRTAAGSALSVRLLAREDAAVLAVLGTGVQALAHARAVARTREFAEIRVAGRDPAKATRIAAELTATAGVEVRAAGSWREALDGADVVCATTHSPDPVVRRDWLAPGAHVTSVGYNQAGRELDDATVAAAAVVAVESRDAVLGAFPAGSNDIRGPIEAGLLAREDLVEIGELVAGDHPGRASAEDLTVYKSVGVGVQDAVAAALVLAAARERGLGVGAEL